MQENTDSISHRLALWNVGDSRDVAQAIADIPHRDLTNAERVAIKRWLPAMRYFTHEPQKKYPYFYKRPDEMKSAMAEIDAIAAHIEHSADEARNLRLSRAITSDYFPPVPDGVTLYPFQRAGVEFALGKPLVMFYDEMGLGKSAEAIATINVHRSPGRILVVCPATLRENWKVEFHRWSTRKLNYHVVTAKTKQIPKEAEVVIVNYDLIWRRDFLGEFSTVIFDECHKVKNAKSRRTKAALQYIQNANLCLVLSGSPMPKDMTDLYTLVNVAIPEVGQRFFTDFVTSDTQEVPFRGGRGMTRTVIRHTGKNHAELSKILRSKCMVRRYKKDVLPQLPPKTRQIVTLPDIAIKMEEKVQARLSQLLEGDDAYRRAFGRGEHAEIDGHIATVRHEQAVLKAPHVVDHISELLQEDETRKVVVFAYHKDVIKILVDGLSAYGCVSITGDTPQKVRQTYVDAFQTGTTTRVFVGNIDAAGEGITLHAAALAVFAELDWVYDKVAQAEDRIHRIGATGDKDGKILIQHVVMSGSVDELIVRSMLNKKRESEAVLA